MDDCARVQACGTRVGLAEFQQKDGEVTLEEVHSPSFDLSQCVGDNNNASPGPVPPEEGLRGKDEVGRPSDSGASEEEQQQQEEEEGMAATHEWVASLVAGSMLDVCNKHGVWFEVSFLLML